MDNPKDKLPEKLQAICDHNADYAKSVLRKHFALDVVDMCDRAYRMGFRDLWREMMLVTEELKERE